MRAIARCKECDNEYEVGIKEFCSEECFKKDIQNRIDEATKNDKSHTSKISKDNS